MTDLEIIKRLQGLQRELTKVEIELTQLSLEIWQSCCAQAEQIDRERTGASKMLKVSYDKDA